MSAAQVICLTYLNELLRFPANEDVNVKILVRLSSTHSTSLTPDPDPAFDMDAPQTLAFVYEFGKPGLVAKRTYRAILIGGSMLRHFSDD